MNELEKSRVEIDAIDTEMAALFEKRMNVCKGIAEFKKQHGLPVVDRSREGAILAKNAAYVNDETYREYYMQFMKDVMKISCSYQSRLIDGMKVAYSGTEGSFGHIAAKKQFPEATLTSFPDFESAYNAVETGEYDCAVLPLENSYAGDVGVVMDLMFSGNLYVNHVIELDVVHNLLALPGTTLSDIKTVVSHPQALEQCEDYIKKNGFESLSYSNTAFAAQYVKEQNDKSIAAIASDETSDVFGLEILERGVNASRSNTTRFAVFSRSQHIPAADSKSENEHFILHFTAKNEAGSLAQTLNIIGAHNFNMRNLKSRPMKELLWNYYFFVEADGNIGSADGQDMLRELGAVCARLKLAGTYNSDKMISTR